MTCTESEPRACLPLSASAGCAADPVQEDASSVSPGDESQADAPSQAASESTSSAAPAPEDASESKAKPPASLGDFERALRGLGFTRLQARHVARKGFAAASANAMPEPTPDPDESEMQSLMAALQRRAAALKG